MAGSAIIIIIGCIVMITENSLDGISGSIFTVGMVYLCKGDVGLEA